MDTADKLAQATDIHSKNYSLLSNLELLIATIQKQEIDHPLGFTNEEFWIGGGKYSVKSKRFTFCGSDKVEYTLEELEFYYKLVHLLTHMAS